MTQLNQLINRFLDDQGTLAPDDLDALIAGLRAEPARAAALREQLVVDDLLAQKLTLDRRNFLAQVEQRIADFEQSEDEIDLQVAELHALATKEFERPPAKGGDSAWIKPALALSLVAVAAALFIVPKLLPRGAQAVAKVVQVSGPVVGTSDERSTALASSQMLFAGQKINAPLGGSLTIEYTDNTQLRIEEQSVVTLDADSVTGAKRVHIERGKIWADVAPQESGAMQFVSPHAVATVLGTQLRLTVNRDDTLLEVTEGQVRLGRAPGFESAGQLESIDVAAHESGVATAKTLDLRKWPDSDESLAYALDPFVRRIPRTRNPNNGQWYENPLESFGSAAVDDLTGVLDLSGGCFRTREDGADIVTVSRSSSEFTLELVFAPDSADQSGPARIVGLEAEGGANNFLLAQDGQELIFSLHTDAAADPPAPLRFALSRLQKPGEFVYLTIVYRDGLIAAYESGRELARSETWHGSLAAWQAGPLAIGASSAGRFPWKGTVEALAVYHRSLPPDEVAHNVHRYRLLSGR